MVGPRCDLNAIWLVAEVDRHIAGWIYAHMLAPGDDALFQLLRELGKSRMVIDAIGVDRPVSLPVYEALGYVRKSLAFQ